MENFFDRYNIPANAIKQVMVGKQAGQYITGYVEYQGPGKAVWNINLPYRTLRWKEDGLWIQITIRGESILTYDEEDLIAIAESLH